MNRAHSHRNCTFLRRDHLQSTAAMALSLLAPNVNAFVAPSMATLQPRITPAITMQETFTPPGILSRPAYLILSGELAAMRTGASTLSISSRSLRATR